MRMSPTRKRSRLEAVASTIIWLYLANFGMSVEQASETGRALSTDALAALVQQVPEAGDVSISDNLVVFTARGVKMCLVGDDESLHLATGFAMETTLEHVNQWNARTRFVKAYVKMDSTVWLESDLPITPRSAEDLVPNWIRHFIVGVGQYLEFESGHQALRPTLSPDHSQVGNRTAAAWRAMKRTDNEHDRLAREDALECFEAMRKSYGEIELAGTDEELAGLVRSYRAVFLEFANIHRAWRTERVPHERTLSAAQVPEDLGEAFLQGVGRGILSNLLDEIDKKYRGQLDALGTRFSALQRTEEALEEVLESRHSIQL